jgi:UDP-N-acetylmuramoyl-L-alanyl-D-glutamate--2,6-diaminopimelate ligase
MTDSQLLETISGRITGLTADSRTVQPGFLFAAFPPSSLASKTDGRDYVAEAIAKGATVLLLPTGTPNPALDGVTVIESDEPRRDFSRFAAAFYPQQPATMVAVTGTSGKTSVADFTRQIWAYMGYKAASLGTLGIVAGDLTRYGSLTTPDAASLHADLASLAQHGITHAVIEASSHGLDQFRLDGVRLTAAAFTNLSRDHLDYHPDMHSYLAAKLRLFTDVLPMGGTAVLNEDVPEYTALAVACAEHELKTIRYGSTTEAELRLLDRTPLPQGQILELAVNGQRYHAEIGLIGSFQAMNVLAALGLVIGSGGRVGEAIAALQHLQGVPGRLENVATTANGATVFVDYAHKPGALETVLTAIRPHVKGELVLVFGCGGDRDQGKRPLMGKIAARLADRVYVTDDNPRREEPAKVRAAIMAACPGATEVGDRAAAIAIAIASLQPGDVLVIAGKGHEPGQIVGDKVLPFNDAEVARSLIRTAA